MYVCIGKQSQIGNGNEQLLSRNKKFAGESVCCDPEVVTLKYWDYKVMLQVIEYDAVVIIKD